MTVMREGATPPALAALYAPGDRPDRFDKAAAAGADFVILDLEDAVTPERKVFARRAVADYLAGPRRGAVVVRINGADTPWHRADLAALADCAGLHGLRIPKVETPEQLSTVRVAFPGMPLQAVVETAVGVENLYDITRAAGVRSVSLGEADLRSDLGITAPDGLAWVRSRLVIAARAAGLPAPMMSVWTALADMDGLRESCRRGRSRGFLGRAAIHPRQIEPIIESFLPTSDDEAHAREVLDALATARRAGAGVAVTPDGHMVDEAMRRAAEITMTLAARGDRGHGTVPG